MKWLQYILPSVVIAALLSALVYSSKPEAKFAVGTCLKISAPGDHKDFQRGRSNHYEVTGVKSFDYKLLLVRTEADGTVSLRQATSMQIEEVDSRATQMGCPK